MNTSTLAANRAALGGSPPATPSRPHESAAGTGFADLLSRRQAAAPAPVAAAPQPVKAPDTAETAPAPACRPQGDAAARPVERRADGANDGPVRTGEASDPAADAVDADVATASTAAAGADAARPGRRLALGHARHADTPRRAPPAGIGHTLGRADIASDGDAASPPGRKPAVPGTEPVLADGTPPRPSPETLPPALDGAGRAAPADDAAITSETSSLTARDAADAASTDAGTARPGPQRGSAATAASAADRLPDAASASGDSARSVTDANPQAAAWLAAAGHAATTAAEPRPGARSAAALEAAALHAPGLSWAPGIAGDVALPPVVALPTPVGTPDFARALAVQVSVLARDGVQQARLELNPSELGPVSVQIVIEGQQARVEFGADALATRQAIEAGLPELAGALREAGLTLSGGGVSQHAHGGQHPEHPDTPRAALLHAGGHAAGDTLAERADAVAQRRIAAGGVDLYA